MLNQSPTDRIALACLQCRSRHVKCDTTQPPCGRCKRDGKQCTYQPSRRGGLDKAALSRRRMKLQQEADATATQLRQTDQVGGSDDRYQQSTDVQQMSYHSQVVLQVDTDRLIQLYYEYFWHPFPVALPYHIFQERMRNNPDHGLGAVFIVMQWIGSIHAFKISSKPYYEMALQALKQPATTPFNVQALMLFAVAQHYCEQREEARKTLDVAVAMALQLRMNEQAFAQIYGEGNTVLEESWRRTYYHLYRFDQEFSIAARLLTFVLANIPNTVNLPCDDHMYQSGQLPPEASWQDYENREFEEIETTFSSLTYLHDLNTFLTSVMNTVMRGGNFDENLIAIIDAKIASWQALLPVGKKDPLQMDGTVDEVMWYAHASAAVLMTIHRSFSALVYSMEEFTTESFMVLAPIVVPNVSRRAAHTARALKAVELFTRLLAIPCAAERHSLFSMSIAAQIATMQISACKNLLEDYALAIGRDRLRLTIGFLNTMGEFWPLGKKMAQEVKAIARSALIDGQDTVQANTDGEGNVMRNEPLWNVQPSSQIDIYSAIVLPMDLEMAASGYTSAAPLLNHFSNPSEMSSPMPCDGPLQDS